MALLSIIVTGFIAPGRHPGELKIRWIAFIVALVIVEIISLAATKMPLLGFV